MAAQRQQLQLEEEEQTKKFDYEKNQIAKHRAKLEDKQKKLEKHKEELAFENERLQHLDLQMKEKERL